MQRATTFFGNLGEFLTNAARWIIFTGRKYPLAAAAYLVVCVFGFFNYLNQSALPPPPPSLTQNPTPLTPTAAPPPLSAPVVGVAQAQAYKDGNSVIIRWSQPVSNPSLYVGGFSLQASCEPQSCTTSISPQTTELRASWQEGGQRFRKNFKF